VNNKLIRAVKVQGGTLLVAQLVEALHYKAGGRGFDLNFPLT
jgi:hypothetical protein